MITHTQDKGPEIQENECQASFVYFPSHYFRYVCRSVILLAEHVVSLKGDIHEIFMLFDGENMTYSQGNFWILQEFGILR